MLTLNVIEERQREREREREREETSQSGNLRQQLYKKVTHMY